MIINNDMREELVDLLPEFRRYFKGITEGDECELSYDEADELIKDLLSHNLAFALILAKYITEYRESINNQLSTEFERIREGHRKLSGLGEGLEAIYGESYDSMRQKD